MLMPVHGEAATRKGCFGTITLYVDEEATASSAFDSYAESIADNCRWSSTEEYWISETNYRNNNYFYTIKSENIYSHTCVLVGKHPTPVGSQTKVYCHLNYKGDRYIGYYNVEVKSLGKLSVTQQREGNVVYLTCPEMPDANLYYFIGDYHMTVLDSYDGDKPYIEHDFYDYSAHKVKKAIPYTSVGITLPSGNQEVEVYGFASYPKYEPSYKYYIWSVTSPKPDKIVLPAEAMVTAGQTITLTPVVTPANAEYTLTWTSDDETIATVNENGVVTGVKKGQTFINVMTDNRKYGWCKVTVTAAAPTAITLPNTATVYVGDTATLTPTLLPEDSESTLNWMSYDEGIVKVDASGVLTGVSEGMTVVTVTTANGISSNPCKITVTHNPSGINDIEADVESGAPVFSLSGQRLTAPRRGVNIVGGKKVLVR